MLSIEPVSLSFSSSVFLSLSCSMFLSFSSLVSHLSTSVLLLLSLYVCLSLHSLLQTWFHALTILCISWCILPMLVWKLLVRPMKKDIFWIKITLGIWIAYFIGLQKVHYIGILSYKCFYTYHNIFCQRSSISLDPSFGHCMSNIQNNLCIPSVTPESWYLVP